MLGMTANDAEALQQILLDIAIMNDAKETLKDGYGQRYQIDFELMWKDRIAIVRSGWILETDSETPRLTSCYPLRGVR